MNMRQYSYNSYNYKHTRLRTHIHSVVCVCVCVCDVWVLRKIVPNRLQKESIHVRSESCHIRAGLRKCYAEFV